MSYDFNAMTARSVSWGTTGGVIGAVGGLLISPMTSTMAFIGGMVLGNTRNRIGLADEIDNGWCWFATSVILTPVISGVALAVLSGATGLAVEVIRQTYF